VIGEFVLGVGAVVDDRVGALDQSKDVLARLARHMFGIGDVADRLAAVLDPIAGCVVRVVERGRSDMDVGVECEGIAGDEVLEVHVRLHGFQRHGEHRVAHLRRQHAVDAGPVVLQMTRHDPHAALGIVGRREEWKSVDVVPMGMGQQQVDVPNVEFSEHLADTTDSGPRIKHEPVVADRNFNAACIAAVLDVIRRRAGDASPNPPEPYPEHLPSLQPPTSFQQFTRSGQGTAGFFSSYLSET